MSEKRPLSPDVYRVDFSLASEVCRLIEQRILKQDNPTSLKWTPATRDADFDADEDVDRRALRSSAQALTENVLSQLFPGVHVGPGEIDTRYKSVEVFAATELADDMTSHKHMGVNRIDLGQRGLYTNATIANEDDEAMQGYTFVLEPNNTALCYKLYEASRDDLRDRVLEIVDDEYFGNVLEAFYGYVSAEDFERIIQLVKASSVMMDEHDLEALTQEMADRYASRQEKYLMEQEFRMSTVDEDELQTLRLLLS